MINKDMTKDKKESVDLHLLFLFGDIVKFVDKEYGELVGTVISRWNERKPNFYYEVSVRCDRRGEKGEDDIDDEQKRYTYKLEGKEKYSNAGYIFEVIPSDIINVIKLHPSNVVKVEKEEKEIKVNKNK